MGAELLPDLLIQQAVDQIRDALCTLAYTDSGFHEDEAQIALDALDYLTAALVRRLT